MTADDRLNEINFRLPSDAQWGRIAATLTGLTLGETLAVGLTILETAHVDPEVRALLFVRAARRCCREAITTLEARVQ